METKKILTTLVVFAVVLAAMSTIIEAQRGGSGGGSGGGGHHLSVNAGSDNDNVGDNNNVGNNAGAIEVSVSTDKQKYVNSEPIEITVTAYNPTDTKVTLMFPVGPPQNIGCQAYYTIDGTSPEFSACNRATSRISIPPDSSYSWPFSHTKSVFPVSVGTRNITGILQRGYGQSDPITITVVPSSDPAAILLKSRYFLPKPGVDQTFEAKLLAMEEPRVHVFVQLYHAPSQAERNLLEENGVKLLAYLPNNAWFASIPPEDVTGIAALQEVRWVGEILPEDKMSPRIRNNKFGDWSLNPDGTVSLIVQFFRDVSLDDAVIIIEKYNGTVDGRIFSINALDVTVLKENITALAGEDYVQWIEEIPPPSVIT